jgi:hypothetical protein
MIFKWLRLANDGLSLTSLSSLTQVHLNCNLTRFSDLFLSHVKYAGKSIVYTKFIVERDK